MGRGKLLMRLMKGRQLERLELQMGICRKWNIDEDEVEKNGYGSVYAGN